MAARIDIAFLVSTPPCCWSTAGRSWPRTVSAGWNRPEAVSRPWSAECDCPDAHDELCRYAVAVSLLAFDEKVRRSRSATTPTRGVRGSWRRRGVSRWFSCRGHAFMRNLRRGHYELGVDVPRGLRVTAAFTELA